MVELSDTTLSLIWLAAMLLLTCLAAADTFREMFPPSRDLLSRLVLVRLQPMLARRQIPLSDYLGRTPRRRMAAQIRTCAICPSKTHCDAILQSAGSADFSFCPSGKELSALAQAVGKASVR